MPLPADPADDEQRDPPGWARDIAAGMIGMYPEEVARRRDLRTDDFSRFRDQPVEYIRQVLQIEPTPKQEEIARLLLQPPYKVIAVSCNNYGKSHLAGSLINWWYDAFDPGMCITTAPTKRDVEDVLWAEVRGQRRTRWDFRGDRAAELYDRPDHYAKGYTSVKVEGFHGRHPDRVLFCLDEAIALKQFVWTGIKSMFKRNGKHHLLGLLNPTDTTSPAYAEAESGNYHVVHLSALEHPNVIAQLKGADEPPIGRAVDCDQLAEWFGDEQWFEPVRIEDFQLGDVVWPPPWTDRLGVVNGVDLSRRALEKYGRDGKRFCLRPAPEGQSRVLGIWPSSTAGAVWSDLAWKCAVREVPGLGKLPVRWQRPPEIGCDVARGTSDSADKTEMIVQVEYVALEHRVGAGWDTTRTVAELVTLADKWAALFNERRDPRTTPFLHPKGIPIKVDDGGLGGGVVDQLKALGYGVVGVNAATASFLPHRYPLMRDQLWFAVPLAARRGEIDLSNLPARSRTELRRQAMQVRWKPDIRGRRKVESKDETKKRLLRSPDGMDALNLAYCGLRPSVASLPHVVGAYAGPLPSQQVPPAGPFSGGIRDGTRRN